MSGPNCLANVPINHQFAIIPYGDLFNDLYAVRFAAENFNLRRTTQTVKDEGTGVPFDVVGSEIETKYPVSGSISMTPRPDQMSTILPCLFGAAPLTATTYGPEGVICDFFHVGHYDPTVAQYFQYVNCVTSNWKLSASDGSPLLKLEWAVEGATRTTAAAATTPFVDGLAAPLPLSIVQPWVFRQATITVGAVTFRIKDIEISGNNNLATDDFFNSAYRVEMPTQKQDFMLKFTCPFDSASDFALLSMSANKVAQIVFTSGAKVLTIDFPNLFARPDDPGVSGKQRIMLPIEWHAQYDPTVVGELPIKITNVP
jgi:Phage tail tube protein